MEPEYISSIAAIMATIGSTMKICVHCLAGGGGISGGGCRSSSPAGMSGAGRRAGLFTTTVDIPRIVRALKAVTAAMAGRCRAPGNGRPAA
ncbi:hypothetical protein GCM10027598_48540 [Amycolatopsis oliviviridis]|uniref:Uncharacterized protein n=1 Tax=Amycolatopsis oliviviridis TaxID=1471590 RepID=A0ABQ3M265_9PSEU|nr:hypothetical protein GCM10017790_65030 [Amycolatopsis oliviviridis]